MTSQVKTILIKAMGNSEIGMGHIYRSISLARELEKEFNVLFCINNNPQVKPLMPEQDMRYFTDRDVKSLIKSKMVDFLLFDQPGDHQELFETLKAHSPRLKIVALDYFNYDNESVDVIINLFNHNLQKSRPDRNSLQYYEGLEYAIIRKEFCPYILQKKKIHEEVNKVLVTFGGADPEENTNKVLQILKMLEFPRVKIEVILGPLWKGELSKTLPSNIRFHYSVSPSLIVNFMAGADLAFCGAGTTMLELLSLGVPTIVLPQNHREERFAFAVEQKGAIKIIKGDAGQEDISCICHLFTSCQERERLSHRSKSLVDGQGKKRIKKIIDHLL